MTDFRRICDVLREEGVLDVLLEVKDGAPLITMTGQYGPDSFRFTASNEDFAEHGL